MAGHSKWANIKHRKERADQKKGKIFSRIMKELMTAVRHGGPDPKTNSRLRIVIQKAKDANIPNENVDRNIKKASSSEGVDYTEMTYELYGYGGVGIIADVMTDNKNRISSDMRIATNKCGGTVATPGSVAYNFDRKGVLQVPKKGIEEDDLFLLVTENGAEDFEAVEETFYITTSVENFYKVKEALDEKKISCTESGLEMVPKLWIECNEEDMKANIALIEYLENLDDVDAVYHNMKMS
jgi:YebC/PmpR family DNA-binding regulatory protein